MSLRSIDWRTSYRRPTASGIRVRWLATGSLHQALGWRKLISRKSSSDGVVNVAVACVGE